MENRSTRISKLLERIAVGVLLGAAVCLALSYHIASEILSAFYLGIFFACVCAGVLMFSYALHVRAQAPEGGGD